MLFLTLNYQLTFVLSCCLALLLFTLPTDSASNGRFPSAYRGTKCWIRMEQAASEVSLTFDFSSLPSNISDEIEWSITNTPFIYGDESCDDLARRVNGTAIRGSAKVIRVVNPPGSAAGGAGPARAVGTVKGMTAFNLQARSVLITEKPSSKVLGCANIISDDLLVFESRFYGPQLAGNVYFFFDSSTRMMKIYSRLNNGNNLDPAVKWTLRNKWWIPDVDAREPNWPSCRESGDKADVTYEAPSQSISALQPETAQLIEIPHMNTTKEALEASILVLTSLTKESWQRGDNVLGCGRIRRSDGWMAEANMNRDQPPGLLVTFKQETLFHPLLVRVERSDRSSSSTGNTSTSSASLLRSDPSVSFLAFDASSNSSSRSTAAPAPITRHNRPSARLTPPSFSVFDQPLLVGRCPLAETKRNAVNHLLAEENSLAVESDDESADASSSTYSAYFTNAALESTKNNLLMKTIRLRWPVTSGQQQQGQINEQQDDECATIEPNRDRTIFAQVSFYYPFVGEVMFAQPISRPESITVVAGHLQHLFDTKPSSNVNFTITVGAVDPFLDELSCSRERDLFDPVSMRTELCRKSNSTCAIGYLSSAQLGPIGISGYGGDGESFAFASRAIPLDGPYSIVGKTLKVDASWVKGCANISYVPSLSLSSSGRTTEDEMSLSSCPFDDNGDRGGNITGYGGGIQSTIYRGAIAEFADTPGVNGTIFMYQSNTADDALPAAATTICNNLKFLNDHIKSNLTYELLDYPPNNNNGTRDPNAVCRNATAAPYNPMFIDTTKQAYGVTCSKNDALCAIGDLSGRLRSASTPHCSCVGFVPISGPFGVSGRLLRIRRADTKQILGCALFESWDVATTDVFVKQGVTRQQVAENVAEEFQIYSSRVQVTTAATNDDTSTSSSNKEGGCVHYSISIFDPRGASIIATISQYNQSVSSDRKWSSNECLISAADAVFRCYVLSVIFVSLIATIAAKSIIIGAC